MDYDQDTFPTQVIPLPIPHDSINETPPQIFKLEVMDLSNNNSMEIMPLHAYIIPKLEKVDIGIQNL